MATALAALELRKGAGTSDAAQALLHTGLLLKAQVAKLGAAQFQITARGR
jgi:hypothetical protein